MYLVPTRANSQPARASYLSGTDRASAAPAGLFVLPELKRNLLYVIIAEATNMGLGAMAESCGVPYDVLAWTAEWYFRAETLEAADYAPWGSAAFTWAGQIRTACSGCPRRSAARIPASG